MCPPSCDNYHPPLTLSSAQPLCSSGDYYGNNTVSLTLLFNNASAAGLLAEDLVLGNGTNTLIQDLEARSQWMSFLDRVIGQMLSSSWNAPSSEPLTYHYD